MGRFGHTGCLRRRDAARRSRLGELESWRWGWGWARLAGAVAGLVRLASGIAGATGIWATFRVPGAGDTVAICTGAGGRGVRLTRECHRVFGSTSTEKGAKYAEWMRSFVPDIGGTVVWPSGAVVGGSRPDRGVGAELDRTGVRVKSLVLGIGGSVIQASGKDEWGSRRGAGVREGLTRAAGKLVATATGKGVAGVRVGSFASGAGDTVVRPIGAVVEGSRVE